MCDLDPFRRGTRLFEDDACLVVGKGTGPVHGMGFADIHSQEFSVGAVAAIEVFEGAKLGPKRSSGETTED